MADLTNQTPADTYKSLLQIGDATNGVDATAKYIEDGEGTDSALAISTDKVGIGTDSPSAMLHINEGGTYTNTDVNNRLIIERDGTAYIAFVSPDEKDQGLHFYNTADSVVGRISYRHRAAGDSLLFKVGGATQDQMVIDSDGNVGIGTASPNSLVEVYSDSGVGNTQLHIHNDQTGDAAVLKLEGGRNTTDENIYQDVGQVLFANKGNITAGIRSYHQGDGQPSNNSFDDGDLRFLTSGHGSSNVITTRMVIDKDGNVGIGTDSPESELHINGDITFSGETSQSQGTRAEIVHTSGVDANGLDAENDGGLLFKSYDNTSPVNALAITHDGKVGIGTTNPSGPLDITSTVSPTIFFNESSNTFQARIGVPSATGNVFSGSAMVGSLAIRNDTAIQLGASTPAVTIKDGNVGIGTASPNAKLEIVDERIIGDIAKIEINPSSAGNPAGLHITNTNANFDEEAAYLKITDQAGSHKFRVQKNGNVGIGTASPDYTLDVNGAVHLGNLTSSTLTHIIRSGGGVTGNVENGLKFIPGSAPSTDQYISFYTGTATPVHIGSIGSASDEILIKTRDSGTVLVFKQDGNVTPGTDDAQDFGSATKRWNDIYATNTTIQTSDRELKQDIEELSEAETRVAQACKGLLRKYRWKSSVAEKGDDARIHFGIMAQDLEAAFAAEGLDAGRYGMFIKNTWWEADRVIPAVEAMEAVEAVYDEEGNEVSPAVEAVEAQPERTELDIFNSIEDAPEGATEVTQRGVRYAELLAFIIAAA